MESGPPPKLLSPLPYKGHSVREYYADLLVEDVLVMELKCAERLANEHVTQCFNYLRASSLTPCLLAREFLLP